jgi:hypothetical protein
MAQVTYHGGPLIPRIEIVGIYLNVVIDSVLSGDWHLSDLQQVASFLDGFLDTITDSVYLDALAEYSEGTPYAIGRGNRLGSYFLTAGPFMKNDGPPNVIETSPDPSALSEATAHNWAHVIPWLKSTILDGALPPPTPNGCYFVFLPPGIVLDFGIGRHDSFPIQMADDSTCEVYFAVIAYSSSQDARYTLDDLTLTVSHELVEAITNPSHAHNGWHADEEAEREIADICEKSWYNYSFNGYQVVSFWLWKHNQCVHCPLAIRLENSVSLQSVKAGQITHFSLDIPCIPQDAKTKLTYRWTVSTGATPMGSDTQQDFFALMPSVPGEVRVTVFVEDTVEASITQMSTTTTYAVVA